MSIRPCLASCSMRWLNIPLGVSTEYRPVPSRSMVTLTWVSRVSLVRLAVRLLIVCLHAYE